MRLGDVSELLWAAYGVELVVPGELLGRMVVLPGRAPRTDVVHWLEGVSGCECLVAGNRWSLVCEGSEFAIVAPAMFSKGFGRVSLDLVAGRAILRGPYEELPRVRRLLAIVGKRRTFARVRLVILDDSKSDTFMLHFADPVQLAYRGGFIGSFASAAVVDALWKSGATVSRFDGLASDGEDFQYSDAIEERFQKFTSSGQEQVFSSEFEVLSAGLTVRLRMVDVGDFWRVSGNLELSDFRQGASEVPDKISRRVSVGLDIPSGAMVRIAGLQIDRGSHAFGFASSRPEASWLGTQSRFSVWLSCASLPSSLAVSSMGGNEASQGSRGLAAKPPSRRAIDTRTSPGSPATK